MKDPKEKGVGLMIAVGGPPPMKSRPGEKPMAEAPPQEPEPEESSHGKCATCRYFSQDGKCQRFPPFGAAGWAQVTPEDYCGEWTANEPGDDPMHERTESPEMEREEDEGQAS